MKQISSNTLNGAAFHCPCVLMGYFHHSSTFYFSSSSSPSFFQVSWSLFAIVSVFFVVLSIIYMVFPGNLTNIFVGFPPLK